MKKLEDILNLPPMPKASVQDQETDDSPSVAPTDLVTIDEKIAQALGQVVELEGHDAEVDHIARAAIDSFQELKDLGLNVSEVHAGRILEVANQLLKTALDARNSKIDRKLKTLDLQLKKLRLDQNSQQAPASATNVGEFDRNELINRLINNSNT